MAEEFNLASPTQTITYQTAHVLRTINRLVTAFPKASVADWIAFISKYGLTFFVPLAEDIIAKDYLAALALAWQQGPQCVADLLKLLGIG